MDRSVLLYLHIPKAAGTTFGGLLFDQVKSDDIQPTGNKSYQSGVLYHPATYIAPLDERSCQFVGDTLARDDLRAVAGHFTFGLHRSIPRPCRYVTILREPVSRLRSLYQFQRLNEQRYEHLVGVRLPDGCDLARFVRSPPYAEIDNGMTRGSPARRQTSGSVRTRCWPRPDGTFRTTWMRWG